MLKVGTPSNTERNVCSSILRSVSVEPLPKRICEASIAMSRASLPWTMMVISSARRFWSGRRPGSLACWRTRDSISSMERRVNILM